jgi:hypothetical protein
MPAYVIHIGPPKTATTYLQRNFTRLAPALRAAGVLYPLDLGTPGHIRLARLLADPAAQAELDEIFRVLNGSNAHAILISAEDLSPLRRPAIERLHHLVGGNTVTLVYYCRRWSEILRSRWGERIKHGLDISLQEYCAEAQQTPLQVSAVNYDRTLRRWTRVFGQENLRLVCLSVLAERGVELVGHFLETFLTFRLDGVPPEDVQNRSLSIVDTEILRSLNGMNLARGNARSTSIRQAFLRQRELLELSVTQAAIAADLRETVFDETRPLLMRLHQRVFAQYRGNLVPPHLETGFFTPGRAVMRSASGAFLNAPGVAEELTEAYNVLTGG